MNFNTVQGADGVAELSWLKPTDIFPNVFNALNVKRRSLFTAPEFGLDLSDITKVTATKIELIKSRITSALSGLLETEKARAIKIEVQKNNLVYNRVDIKIEIIQSDNQPIIIEEFITVGV